MEGRRQGGRKGEREEKREEGRKEEKNKSKLQEEAGETTVLEAAGNIYCAALMASTLLPPVSNYSGLMLRFRLRRNALNINI